MEPYEFTAHFGVNHRGNLIGTGSADVIFDADSYDAAHTQLLELIAESDWYNPIVMYRAHEVYHWAGGLHPRQEITL